MSHPCRTSLTPEEAAILKSGPRLWTREEVAEREVGVTKVSPLLCRWIIALFLATIAGIPLAQHLIDVSAGRCRLFRPRAANALRIPASAIGALTGRDFGTSLSKLHAANTRFLAEARAYETALENDSFLSIAAIPPTQAITARYLGLGNEQVYIGRDGWLFYQPEVGHLANEGFLSENFLGARSRASNAGEEVQPDPLKAILDFRDQLANRGIRLLLLPTPPKPMIEPEHLSARFAPFRGTPIQNPSYPDFLNALQAAGVECLDVCAVLADEKQRTGRAQFLRTDTHWTPETMEMTAQLLSEKLHSMGIAADGSARLRRVAATVANTGDIAAMLKLPADSGLYPPETARIHAIQREDGTDWAPGPNAPVLVLGDSFSNIYSLESMRWGKSAGLVEQLAFCLQVPVDAILRNDAGAHATRELLARELARGRDRLAGKKVVVWEFAMRELSVGDWKRINLPTDRPSTKVDPAPVAQGAFYVPANSGAPVRVTATVTAASKIPQPGSVPYKDHIFAVSLTGLVGPGIPTGSRAVVYLWSMKDNALVPAAQLKPGDRVTLDLRPWNDVAGTYDRFNRSELDDDSLQLEPPCWGELEKQP